MPAPEVKRRWWDQVLPPSAGQHFEALDGLRGMACLAVMLWHVTALCLGMMGSSGPISVCVFFALSAFLLYYPAAIGKPFDVRRYFVRRFWRIYPAYLVVLPLGCLAVASRGLPVTTTDFLAHLLFLHTVFPQFMYTIIGPSWSLATEVQFYVLLPALVLAFGERRRWLLWGLLALAVLPQMFGMRYLGYWANMPFMALPFLCGMVAARLVARYPVTRGPLAGVGLLTLLGLALTMRYPLAIPFVPGPPLYILLTNPRGLLASVAALLAIVGLATNHQGLTWRLASWRPLRVCGVAGYGIFLIHEPLLWLLIRHVGKYEALWLTPPLAIALGLLSWVCIEAPVLRWALRRGRTVQ